MSPAKTTALGPVELRARSARKWSRPEEGTLGADVAEMDFGTAPAVVDAVRRVVEGGTLGYAPERLGKEMAEACAKWQLERHAWRVPAERIHPLPDILGGLRAAIEHFSRPASPVIVPVPAYQPFLTLPAALGRQVLQVPMADDGQRLGLDLERLDRAFSQGGHLMVLCNPCNPVGRVLSAQELEEVCAVVDHHGGRVFADEVHAPLVYPGRRHIPYASIGEVAAGHTLTATSASKGWNVAGLKCAQLLITNDADALVWERVGGWASHGASTPGIAASTAAFSAGRAWLDGVLEYLDGSRRLLDVLLNRLLPDVRCHPVEGTYLAWLDCRPLGLGDAPARAFLEHAGVALVEGADCGWVGAGHVRLNFATPQPILRQIVSRMAMVPTDRDRH